MSAREELLCRARKLLWQAWSQSSEEIGSAAVSTLMGLGMLVPEGGAAELERLRLLMNAQPVELTEEQRDALTDAGNRALNDHYHDDLCHCREWPASCASGSGYFMGTWDTAAFDIGLGAVLGLWEAMRADCRQATEAEIQSRELSSALAELKQLRARVAELETAAKQARTEALADAGDYLDEVGEKNAAFLLYTTDVPAARAMKPVAARQAEDPHESPLHHPYELSHDLPARADLPESLR